MCIAVRFFPPCSQGAAILQIYSRKCLFPILNFIVLCMWPSISSICLLPSFCLIGCNHYFQIFYRNRFIRAWLDNKTLRESIVVGALLFEWNLKPSFHSLVTFSSSPVLLLPEFLEFTAKRWHTICFYKLCLEPVLCVCLTQ